MMLRTWIARAGAAGLLIAVSAGCFTDVETPMADCEEGALGCDCISGVCGPDLQCAPEANVCIPSDCTPGTNGCVCDTGSRCDAPFVCSVGVCMVEQTGTDDSATGGSMPTTASTTSAPMSTTSTSMSTTDAVTTEAMTTEVMTTDGMTTAPDTSSSSTGDESSSTGDAIDCVETHQRDCASCAACVDEPGQSCFDTASACDGLVGCSEILVCLDSCGIGGLCFEDCCDGEDPVAVDMALAAHQCHRDECASVYCVGFVDINCSQ